MRYVNMKLPVLAQVSSTAFRPRIRHDLNSSLQCMPIRPMARKSLAQPLRLTLTKIRVLSPDLGLIRPKTKKRSVIDAAPHNILFVIALSPSRNAATATKTVIGWTSAGLYMGSRLILCLVLVQTEGLKGIPIETSPSSEVTRTIVVFPPLILAPNMEN